MKKIILLFYCLLSFFFGQSQHSLNIVIKDSVTNTTLSNVNAIIAGSTRTMASDSIGKLSFQNLSAGNITIIFSHIGFETQRINIKIPQQEALIIYLSKAAEKIEAEVIISSSRTNSRIEDLPTKVEVIGSEEVDEEGGTMPGNIASLLGDVAGIQNQRTSGTTGSVDLRVQGLPGKYTQILRDGLPLFGGYSGSFSLLQIPPLMISTCFRSSGGICNKLKLPLYPPNNGNPSLNICVYLPGKPCTRRSTLPVVPDVRWF